MFGGKTKLLDGIPPPVLAGIIVLLVGVIFFLTYKCNYEYFNGSLPYDSASELDEAYLLASNDIGEFTVDTQPCDPSCCGQDWPYPFDGLTSKEINEKISAKKNEGQFVRTNYTCGNGFNGDKFGCPCIDKNNFMFLANRGQGTKFPGEVEPTISINRKRSSSQYSYDNIVDNNEFENSVYRNQPKLNDVYLTRDADNLINVEQIVN